MIKKYKNMLTFIAIVMVAGLYYYIQPLKNMSSDKVNGKIKYIEYCLSCHGEKGYGDGHLASSLPKKPNDINNKFKTTWKPDNRLTRRILVGKPDSGMPAFEGILNEKDAEDVLAYVRSIE